MNFTFSKIRQLNELEMSVFDEILANLDEAQNLTVRELATRTHTSTATVLRMTKTLGFKGWTDFRYYLQTKAQEEVLPVNYYENLLQLDLFLKGITSREYSEKLAAAIKLIKSASYVVFVGLGTSGSLSDYSAKYFTNSGIESYAISDPYQAIKRRNEDHILNIILSVSGETDKLVDSIMKLRENHAKIISITNRENTTISKMSDINLSYNFREEYSTYDPLENLTSQLPVLSIIEILAHEASKENKILE